MLKKKIRNLVSRVYNKTKSYKNLKSIKKTSKPIGLNNLVKDLKTIGINEGDTLLVHSSLRSIGFVENGASTVVNALIAALGNEGTLVMPAYSMMGTMYKTCKDKNYVFDLNKTSTVLGAIPSEFLKQEGISRSIHPTHSISSIGKNAKKITGTHHIGNKTFGENSPWAKIIELNGKILGIGISLGPTTQYHHVEDILDVDFPIRVKTDNIFKIKCRIDKNNYIEVEVQPLDPEVAKKRIDKRENDFIRNYFWEIFQKINLLNIGYIGEARSWWINAREFHEYLIKLANLGITIYSTREELEHINLYPFELIESKLKKSN